jgi:DNA-binding transcriptional LysR family regulator
MNLRNFDLNLLVIVDVVLTELSVTQAAKRLNLSQPSVSQAMARAREVFGDDLLVRDGSGMRLTPAARRIAPQLKAFCLAAVNVLSAPVFDPRTAQLQFTICANDLTEMLVLPPVIAAIDRVAPGCRVSVKVPPAHLIDATIDLAIIGASAPEGPFLTRDIFEEHFLMLARPGHPRMGQPLTAEDYAGLQHVLVSPTGQGSTGPVDKTLEKLGLARRVALNVTRFTTLPSIIASTDFVAAVPSRFAQRPEVQALCAVWPLPFDSPRFTMKMVWHEKHDADPASVWLRSLF